MPIRRMRCSRRWGCSERGPSEALGRTKELSPGSLPVSVYSNSIRMAASRSRGVALGSDSMTRILRIMRPFGMTP